MACPLVINKNSVKTLAAWWLSNESSLNYVGLTPKSGRGKVYIDMHSPGIIVGMPFVEAILKESSCEIEWHICEGQPVKSCPVRVATITGANEDIFFCENLVLSVLSRASGIASLASRIQSILQEVSWKGTMYMPDRRTPGFGLVEEYAMMISGISERKSSVSVRCKDMDAGSLKSAIDEVRSRVGSIPVHVACCRLDEACLAAGAGADILLTGLSAKEIVDIASQVKESYPEIQVIASGSFDDSDVKLCATRYVDHLTSLKLCNGYAFVDFQMTYVKDSAKNTEPTKYVLLERNEISHIYFTVRGRHTRTTTKVLSARTSVTRQ
ncbi:Nicotinate-nucleotide pyrophosphorylase [carboxylating] [Schistosoma japonicum]|uniref:Quinolinate phosphoribosyltransferase [decarboxylating] n=1 Tax=Schistosoma japonicum TaxID=6182 RepID=A0A4Z2CNE9_SCHJA|nr:Nicotinate-nucleotide pyrophosphorylase [carboxylating] [Schistosoma japonicum]